MVLVALASVAGCGERVATGTAFYFPGSAWSDTAAMPPGVMFGSINSFIQNTSTAPLTVDSVRVQGTGLGTVVRVTEVMMAPAVPGHGVPGSVYVTRPPVFAAARGCDVQTLLPVHGYRVLAGHGINGSKAVYGRTGIRLWIVVQALRPGRYRINDEVVTYTQGGTRYRQVLRDADQGTVAVGANWPAPDNEAGCLGQTRLLNPGYPLGRVTGRMVLAGSPKPPPPGFVDATDPHGDRWDGPQDAFATGTGPGGTFGMSLPPNSYRLTGLSVLHGRKLRCAARGLVRVRAHRTTTGVTLACAPAKP
jgi:hypothetical protein